jgi:hypothetical protein
MRPFRFPGEIAIQTLFRPNRRFYGAENHSGDERIAASVPEPCLFSIFIRGV